MSGNVTHREESGQGVDFEYDGEDRQRRASSSSNYSELYFYDENGQRFLAIEIDPAGSLERSRMWFGVSEFWTNHKGGNIRTMTNLSLGALAVGRVDTDDSNNTSLEYSFHNGLGHLMGTVDESGQLTTAFVYGPFGEIMEQSGAVDNHLRRFNGKEADQLSRLNYYGYRYYDPLSLQWTQADPLYRVAPDIAYDQPRRMGLYTFSLNNPVRYFDPDGRDATGTPTLSEYNNMVQIFNRGAQATTEGGRASAALALVDASAKAHNLPNKASFALGKVSYSSRIVSAVGNSGNVSIERGSTDSKGNVTVNRFLVDPRVTTVEEAIAFTPHEGVHVKDVTNKGAVPPGDIAEKHGREVKAFQVQIDTINNLPNSKTKGLALKRSRASKLQSTKSRQRALKKRKKQQQKQQRVQNIRNKQGHLAPAAQ